MIDKWVINQRKTLKSNNFSVRGETEIPASSSFRLLTPVHVRPYRKCHVVHSRLPVPCFCCCQVILPSPSCLVSSASTFLVLFSQLLNSCTYCDNHLWLYRSVSVQVSDESAKDANAAITLLEKWPEKIQALNWIRTHNRCVTAQLPWNSYTLAEYYVHWT